jgi:hypothetical protein
MGSILVNYRLETRSNERVMRFRADGYADMRVLLPLDFVFTFGLVLYLGSSAQIAYANLNS